MNLHCNGSSMTNTLLVTVVLASRALTELVHDVKEAEEAIAGVLDDDQALAAICLSEKDADRAVREGRQAPSMRLAAALLGSYERQIQSVEGALRVCLSQTWGARGVANQSRSRACWWSQLAQTRTFLKGRH